MSTFPTIQYYYDIMDVQNKTPTVSQRHLMMDTPNPQDAVANQESNRLTRLSSWWATPPPSDETPLSFSLSLLPPELRLQIYTHLGTLSESRAKRCLGVFVTHTPASELQRLFCKRHGLTNTKILASTWHFEYLEHVFRVWSFEPRGKDCYLKDAVFADYARDWPEDIGLLRKTMRKRVFKFPNAMQKWVGLAKEYGVDDGIAPVGVRLFIPSKGMGRAEEWGLRIKACLQTLVLLARRLREGRVRLVLSFLEGETCCWFHEHKPGKYGKPQRSGHQRSTTDIAIVIGKERRGGEQREMFLKRSVLSLKETEGFGDKDSDERLQWQANATAIIEELLAWIDEVQSSSTGDLELANLPDDILEDHLFPPRVKRRVLAGLMAIAFVLAGLLCVCYTKVICRLVALVSV
ncbi:hypothetical protein AUEXF2481DRAFT_44922 [Aureobasidium subglaciale EXF-2481]|uniref:Uncharacterized protein n=1 Tax=Aureobasidium subglaciale (strain EXF-2481) TaxID=1043005 RepID=A0A074Y3T6_AURSE|nr:uncharacterized protein AUEXF2481DRAFT_44922 [Aureobasidium subglaciale EXF-2481]KEQ90594.1 hypothetical protein AUEXF2481DRAFT_44922 [Aureobasidium subglaciale EXF-2481]